jgi:hypothetical protein
MAQCKQYWSHGVAVNLSAVRVGISNSLAGLIAAIMAPILEAVLKTLLGLKAFVGAQCSILKIL